jgi:hypothetical protein
LIRHNLVWLSLLLLAPSSYTQEQHARLSNAPSARIEHTAPISGPETLHYGVEWRLIRAGTAKITWTPQGSPESSYQAQLLLQSAGVVTKLYRVHDTYVSQMSDQLCADNFVLNAEEGKRRRETKVSFDHAGKIHYHERDLVKNTTVLAKEIDSPPCVQEIIGGLYRLRTLKLEPGQSAQVPVSDGKKFANAKVEAQEREEIRTPTGQHKTIRHEVFIFNNVLYSRNARAFVWLTDDARRTPVRIQVRLRFIIGTITLDLEKEERT